MESWYTRDSSGAEEGPLTENQVRKRVASSRSGDLWVKKGNSPWHSAAEVRNRFRALSEEGWYLRANNRIAGPYTQSKIRELFQNNSILGSTLARQGENGEWKPLHRFLAKARSAKPSLRTNRAKAEVASSQAAVTSKQIPSRSTGSKRPPSQPAVRRAAANRHGSASGASVSIRTLCPSCGKKLVAPERLAGKKVRCPCGHAVLVPIAESVKPSPETPHNTPISSKEHAEEAALTVVCANCRKTLRCRQEMAGKRTRCPVCSVPMTVPARPVGRVFVAAPAASSGPPPIAATAPKLLAAIFLVNVFWFVGLVIPGESFIPLWICLAIGYGLANSFFTDPLEKKRWSRFSNGEGLIVAVVVVICAILFFKNYGDIDLSRLSRQEAEQLFFLFWVAFGVAVTLGPIVGFFNVSIHDARDRADHGKDYAKKKGLRAAPQQTVGAKSSS